MLDAPRRAVECADTAAGWPADVAQECAEIVVGLSWERYARRRMPLDRALERLEALSRRHQVRSGVAAAEAGEEIDTCVLCMSTPPTVRFACGHMTCCDACAASLSSTHRSCPLCRAPIDSASAPAQAVRVVDAEVRGSARTVFGGFRSRHQVLPGRQHIN